MCNPEEEGMDANDDGVQAAADDDDAALNPLEKEDPSDWRCELDYRLVLIRLVQESLFGSQSCKARSSR